MDCYVGLIASARSLSELDIAVKPNRLLIQLQLNLDEACNTSLEPKDLPQKWIIMLLDLHHWIYMKMTIDNSAKVKTKDPKQTLKMAAV